MSKEITWSEIGVRLALAVAAGLLIGFDRGEHGRPAGLRTTLLVTLAAAVSMVQVNLMLATAGKSPDSFVVMDLMRLPLGILSGMGFIGGGAILRRGNLVTGVTTAATLWFVTVVGLCFGGGQLALGGVATALGFGALHFLKALEKSLKQDQRGTFVVTTSGSGPNEEEIVTSARAAGYRVRASSSKAEDEGSRYELTCQVQWRARSGYAGTPPFIAELARRQGVLEVAWRPHDLWR